MTRPYTRSAPVSLHVGKEAALIVRTAKFSGAVIVDIRDERDGYAGSVWFENEAAMHRFAEALKGKVEA